MKTQNKEFCNLGESGSLELKCTKSKLALKKDQVAQLLLQYGEGEEKAANLADFLFNNKEVRERSVLKRSLHTVD